MKALIRKTYDNTLRRLIPPFESELERLIAGSGSLLDVGCGAYSPIKDIQAKPAKTTGIDAFEPSIERSRADGIHANYVLGDILSIQERFGPNAYDTVLASDVIEHLPKEEGYKLLDRMESVASKNVIVFTPNGFLKQGEYDKNPYQVHRSGWSVSDLAERGYKVIGVGGWKPLKGEYGKMTLKPWRFWFFIADLTQHFVRKRPEKAYQLLAIKDV